MGLVSFRSSRPSNGRKLILPSIIISFMFWVYISLDDPGRLSRSRWDKDHDASGAGPTSKNDKSSAQWLEHQTDIFDAPLLDSQAIRDVCSKTKWNASVTFTCNNSGGGVGNQRNSILNCLRYAISAGASMTMPRMILRNPGDIADIWNRERTSFDYLFDEGHFVESMRLSCPQMRILNGTREGREKSIFVNPEKIAGDIGPEGLTKPEEWRERFYGWLSRNTSISTPVIDLDRSYLQYPIHSDAEAFALDFGKLLKFRRDTRMAATAALKNMVRKYNLTGDYKTEVWKGGFYGVHLRTERDSQQGWPPTLYEYSKYATQSTSYLKQAAGTGMKVMYVASGNVEEIEKFAYDAKAYNMSVTTKHQLLEGEDKKKMEKFTFDQQALVDYLVLLKSSDFAGVGHSSFAWNIALWRHQFAKQRDHLNGPQLMSDELSQIYGKVRQYPEYSCCLWP
ncbi:uncharacterized protein RSE6_15071 [Rhynchosporium secalis]|uniref:Alternative oxidase n=1 Tax=Rhynchosporium secalis TaxID=38038 RepID=A0A1E1MWM9_RHYSE|nr:uncharacterized protein RSE6_15071 [Rhynchosporium secalis]